jgi:hypothetical protein
VAKRYYDSWLKAYTDYAQYSEAPLHMHFWTGVSVLAGALRRQVWMDMGYFQWVPNFYIILVAPPGVVSKSSTMSIGIKLLKQVQGIHFGPDAVTWQALIQSIAGASEMVPMPDGTYHPMSAITIASSEFGNLLNPQDREMVDALTSLWDGQIGQWEKVTKTQGTDTIVNPFINIIACTTPGWIAAHFPEHMIGGGFTSRCILVYAERKAKLVAYPVDILPPDFQEMQTKLVHDLELISTIRGAYTLSPEAKAWGYKWYDALWSHRPKHLDNEVFGNYVARKQTHIHKLALVISASQRDSRIIERDDLETADAVTSALEIDMTQVFGGIGRSQDVKFATELVELVRQHRSIAQGALYRLMFNRMTFGEFQEALKSAINAGLVGAQQRGTDLTITFKGEPANG